jgi:hypothetical protein
MFTSRRTMIPSRDDCVVCKNVTELGIFKLYVGIPSLVYFVCENKECIEQANKGIASEQFSNRAYTTNIDNVRLRFRRSNGALQLSSTLSWYETQIFDSPDLGLGINVHWSEENGNFVKFVELKKLVAENPEIEIIVGVPSDLVAESADIICKKIIDAGGQITREVSCVPTKIFLSA